MNPLTERFPTEAKIQGRRYALRPDFRTCVRIVLACEAPDLTWWEKQAVILRLLYPEIPPDHGAALRCAVRFLDGGAAPRHRADGEEPYRLYSFQKDGMLIYSAFYQQYGIDLNRDDLHWWAFLALFNDLDPECRFYRILRLRQGYLDGTLTKEEMQHYRDMGEVAAVPEQPVDRAEQQAIDRFLQQLGQNQIEEG